VLRQSRKDVATVAAAGITLHEALAACEELKKQGILIRVIDLYSIKPIDKKTLARAAKETRAIIVVEDHYSEGGIGEAVRSALPRSNAPIISLDFLYSGSTLDSFVFGSVIIDVNSSTEDGQNGSSRLPKTTTPVFPSGR